MARNRTVEVFGDDKWERRRNEQEDIETDNVKQWSENDRQAKKGEEVKPERGGKRQAGKAETGLAGSWRSLQVWQPSGPRQGGKEGRGRGSGGAQTIGPASYGEGGRRGAGRRERHQNGAIPGGPVVARRPPGSAAAASYRLGLLSAQQPGRPGPSWGTSRAASPGLCLCLRPGSGRGGSRSGASWGRSAGSAQGFAGGSWVRALKLAQGPLPSPPPPPPPPASPDATPGPGDVSRPRRAGSGPGLVTWLARVGPGPRSRLAGRRGRRGFAVVDGPLAGGALVSGGKNASSWCLLVVVKCLTFEIWGRRALLVILDSLGTTSPKPLYPGPLANFFKCTTCFLRYPPHSTSRIEHGYCYKINKPPLNGYFVIDTRL